MNLETASKWPQLRNGLKMASSEKRPQNGLNWETASKQPRLRNGLKIASIEKRPQNSLNWETASKWPQFRNGTKIAKLDLPWARSRAEIVSFRAILSLFNSWISSSSLFFILSESIRLVSRLVFWVFKSEATCSVLISSLRMICFSSSTSVFNESRC